MDLHAALLKDQEVIKSIIEKKSSAQKALSALLIIYFFWQNMDRWLGAIDNLELINSIILSSYQKSWDFFFHSNNSFQLNLNFLKGILGVDRL